MTTPNALAPTVAMGSHYEAATSSGPVRLVILGMDPARHAADAAVALDDCADLLDELDAWLGNTLDWRWCRSFQGDPATSVSLAARIGLAWREGPGGPPRCRIELPWAMLRALGAPRQTLHTRLVWPEVPVILSLATFDLEPGESLALEPGGAVLLPDSFSADWRGRLRAVDEPVGSGVPLSFGTPGRPQVLPLPADGAAAAEPLRYEVRMFGPSLVRADRLAGWSGWDFRLPDTPARLWRCGTDEDPAECVATGQLIPWGAGFALLVESAWKPRT
jgi:hypothetical protein